MAIEMTSHTLVNQLYSELVPRVERLKAAAKPPALAVVLVGHDPKSELYVSSIKRRRAAELGIDFTVHRLDEQIDDERLISTIEQLNQQPAISGIILQLPLPDQLNVELALESVALSKDVDGLAPNSAFLPPTVQAILGLLEAYDIPLTERQIVVVGQGRLVGLPLTAELRRLKLNVISADERTANLAELTQKADILISATGQENLITGEMIKEGSVIIDVDRDVDYENVKLKAGVITPPIGGVGPLTVAYLLSNVVEAAEHQSGLDDE